MYRSCPPSSNNAGSRTDERSNALLVMTYSSSGLPNDGQYEPFLLPCDAGGRAGDSAREKASRPGSSSSVRGALVGVQGAPPGPRIGRKPGWRGRDELGESAAGVLSGHQFGQSFGDGDLRTGHGDRG